MEKRALGRTGIDVSALCLGTMTWGTQNGYEDAASQIERALDAGVNFIDTAEMYPTTPLSADTLGDTERLLGRWLDTGGRRDEIVLATKVTGSGRAWLNGGHELSGSRLREALEGSLSRLKVECVDLYQLHWPNRSTYHFRKHWDFDPSTADVAAMDEHVADLLGAAADLIREGKLRAIGLSNDSAWGTMKFLQVAEREGLPRVASVQNEYSLLCRLYDTDMAELSCHEGVPLLAFSPLAAGMLSGKYENAHVPPGSRRSINAELGGRWTAPARQACEAYVALAREHGLDPAAMAIAWALSRPFMGSVIIGATRPEQLDVALSAASLTLSDEVLEGIAAVRRAHPLPM